jgi:hypothetical protein
MATGDEGSAISRRQAALRPAGSVNLVEQAERRLPVRTALPPGQRLPELAPADGHRADPVLLPHVLEQRRQDWRVVGQPRNRGAISERVLALPATGSDE